MVSAERNPKTKLDAKTFTCFASRSCVISRYRMEWSTMVGEVIAMCLYCTIVEEFVAGKVTTKNIYRCHSKRERPCRVETQKLLWCCSRRVRQFHRPMLSQLNGPLIWPANVTSIRKCCLSCLITSIWWVRDIVKSGSQSFLTVFLKRLFSGCILRLESAFVDFAQTYYKQMAQMVRIHRDQLTTSHQFLKIRHQFKMGFIAEMRFDYSAALK